MDVWAVTFGNYEPPEVIALYDNEAAAQVHAATDSAFQVARWTVESTYTPAGGG